MPSKRSTGLDFLSLVPANVQTTVEGVVDSGPTEYCVERRVSKRRACGGSDSIQPPLEPNEGLAYPRNVTEFLGGIGQ